nr:DUF5131 family protein [Geopsychrobacter electrodiphilus]
MRGTSQAAYFPILDAEASATKSRSSENSSTGAERELYVASFARPMKEDWVRDLRDQCTSQNVPFFFKQWGGVSKKKAGRTLDRKTWQQFPVAD